MPTASLPDLGRRLSRKIETQRGIQLSPADLDLLVSTGAYVVICNAVAEYQRDQCLKRSARSRSINGGNSNSTPEPIEQTSKSSGTTQSEDVSALLRQVQAITGRGA